MQNADSGLKLIQTYLIPLRCHCEPEGHACTPKCRLQPKRSFQALWPAGVAISLVLGLLHFVRNDNLINSFVIKRVGQEGN